MRGHREFELAVETFLLNVGVQIDGDIDEKMDALEADGDLATEFAYYLFKALEVLERELESKGQRSNEIRKFLGRHLRVADD